MKSSEKLETAATLPAINIDRRSPKRFTRREAGSTKAKLPTVIIPATKPAVARLAPSAPAAVGTIGSRLASPIENRVEGKKTGSAKPLIENDLALLTR